MKCTHRTFTCRSRPMMKAACLESAMMPLRLLLLLHLTGHVFARKPPDVSCLLMNLEYVHCTWNGQGTPEVNYTFYNRFHHESQFSECATYISENSTVIGCNQRYEDLLLKRFYTFYTRLVHGNNSNLIVFDDLKSKVKLYPPANLTVQNGTDSNLWFYWNHSAAPNCVESEVRYRTNYNKWEFSKLSVGKQNYCINLPSSSSRYELQVRSSMGDHCGASDFCSDWSQPVVWGSIRENSNTDPSGPSGSMSVLTTVASVVVALTLILLVMLLVHIERLRIILIPIVPKPAMNLDEILINGNVEDWLPISKGLKEGFKANFNERACSVREYNRVPQSASESSDSSTFSTTTDQTDFSASTPANESEGLSTSCSSSTSTLPVFSEEGQIAP